MKDSDGQEQDECPSLIREDRIRKIHAECFPDDPEKIVRSAIIRQKPQKADILKSPRSLNCVLFENEMEAPSNGQDD